MQLRAINASSINRKLLSSKLIDSIFSAIIVTLVSACPGQAQDLPTNSVTINKHINKAAEYYEKGDFARAKEEFRAVISYTTRSIEPYEGLLHCSEKTKDWPQVSFAAEKIAALCPERKNFYEYDFGTALFNMNRYDEAVPHLQRALVSADISVPEFKPVKVSTALNEATNPNILTGEFTQSTRLSDNPSTARLVLADSNHVVTSESSVDFLRLENFENAIRSEFICIAEYQGYDKSDDIRFNSAVATHWQIKKILKGPPLNKSLPLRYDFHTPNVKHAPVGWHFDESLLPKKGSQWILFIEYAYPEGTKQLFTTYDGSYGRQPATEDNLNELDRLLEDHKMKIEGL